MGIALHGYSAFRLFGFHEKAYDVKGGGGYRSAV